MTLVAIKAECVQKAEGSHRDSEREGDKFCLGAMSGRSIYQSLLAYPESKESLKVSRLFLKKNLEDLKPEKCDFPTDPWLLKDWVAESAVKVAGLYRDYLRQRKSGGPRVYFKSRGQALSFISKIAPTKLVDGAWLYGVLKHWKDVRYRSLVRIFLEELGNGDPDKNHVVLYKKLLSGQEVDVPENLDDKYYFQGALQLALGYHCEEFLPELIGYNLGYEQLPLHLLITAYELGELGIDPYYFTLHVTIDNASTGHAQKAVQAVMDNLPVTEDKAKSFYQRIRRGYMLNELGVGSVAIIRSFDAYQEVLDILKRKSRFAQVHSDYQRIKGLTVNQWLVSPEKIPGFLDALIDEGWIKFDRDPTESPFWRLLQGPKACMFGVFSPFEQEIIYEWIAGSWLDISDDSRPIMGEKWSNKACLGSPVFSSNHGEAIPFCFSGGDDREQSRLYFDVEGLPFPERVQHSIELMAPGKHHTPAGLMATRIFSGFLKTN